MLRRRRKICHGICIVLALLGWTTLIIIRIFNILFTLTFVLRNFFDIITLSTLPLLYEPFSYKSVIRISRKLVKYKFTLLFAWILGACLLSACYRSLLLTNLMAREKKDPIDTYQVSFAQIIVRYECSRSF